MRESVESLGSKLSDLMIDANGRPYFACVVTSDAPEAVFERAIANLRVVRLAN